MFGHRSFLMLGGGAADIMSLIKGGYEIKECRFAFEQGIDRKGKASTRVYGGTIHLILSQLPPIDIIEWAIQSRKYQNGVIVLVDNENIPYEKIFFENAACINMEIDYVQSGDSYSSTKITIQSERLIVGDGINFNNEWNF